MSLKYTAIEWVVYRDVSCIIAPSKRGYCDANNTVNCSVQSAVEENVKSTDNQIKESFKARLLQQKNF
jgi:hypothetical protein